jgi:serine-type D-Ala-D-Ala carboxypeptidase (penicillin-binding protein 5/6)
MSVYRVRRRRALLLTALALVLARTLLGVGSHLLSGRVGLPNQPSRASVAGQDQTEGSAVSWPLQGQASLMLGNGRPAASAAQQPVPIASLAKVMTAYLTLKRYPLRGAQAGFTLTVTEAEVQAEAADVGDGQSGVAVQTGELLTERQLLEALLVPSGNNIAEMLAVHVAGSEPRFVAEMDAEARSLGMQHTVYTDPSGFDTDTVSTAADQLLVFRQAMDSAVFRQIVSMASVTLPVAGTLTNFNPLVAEAYAGKTGSDSAAGGCLAFFTHVTIGGRRQTAVGVVLGQGQGSDTSVLLAAAGEAAWQLVASATHAARAAS